MESSPLFIASLSDQNATAQQHPLTLLLCLRKQLTGRHAETPCNLLDVGEADVHIPAFNGPLLTDEKSEFLRFRAQNHATRR